MIAFSKLSFVTISEGLIPFSANSTALFPDSNAYFFRSSESAGRSAEPGKVSPSASAIICIVEAVPINEQAPQLGQAFCFAQSYLSRLISPRSYLALYIPSCSNVNRFGPAFIVPPQTTMEGIFTLAMPIIFPGSPLSHDAINTAPSNGVAFAWISIILAIISREGSE